MYFPWKRRIVLVIAVLVSVVALGCGSSASESTPISKTDPTPDRSATSVPAVKQLVAPTPGRYDPNAMMYRLFPRIGPYSQTALDALEEVRQRKDLSQVPVLVEMIWFTFPASAREEVAATLRELTGQSLGGNDTIEWTEWLGRHRQEYRPPEEYLGWKINLLSQIHPRFALFLQTADETARIDLTEIVWGGVPPDGIPDLRDPETTSAEEAGYLEPDDRVFGVSINGENRAYPLRIVNAHEMVNDVLGGEPIALVW